jgi:hypothetical protein
LIWIAWFGWNLSTALDWGAGVGVVLGMVSLYWLWKQRLGENREWRDGKWTRPKQKWAEMKPTVAQVRPPREAWKANVFWGVLLGGLLTLGGVISFSDGLLEGTIPTWLGLNFMGWMGLSAINQWSQTVWAGEQGIEIRSLWGRRRVAWSEIRRVWLKDLGKELEKGREILSLDVVSKPKDQLKLLIERAQLETGLGGRSEGAAG